MELACIAVRPGAQPEAEQRFADASRNSTFGASLLASWHTENGPLNRIVQLRTGMAQGAPDLADIAQSQETWPLEPFEFSPVPAPGACGPWFELRVYPFQPGELARITAQWGRAIPERVRRSPLVGVWTVRSAPLHRLVHIWAYPSLDARVGIRARAIADGIWPPTVTARPGEAPYKVESMESWIMAPAGFSPIR
ncbi:MAG: NIPSNAP family protein [Gammaproteobacteria bacterium]